jgi:hypothetical protein
MKQEMDKRFIIVGFSDGIGHTLQLGNKLEWFFSRPVKLYKNLPPAIKEANRVNSRWKCDRVVVYEIEIGDRISFSFFKDWENRIRFEINNEKQSNEQARSYKNIEICKV